MDFINSRHLTDRDGFVQVFSEADHYIYYVTTAPEGYPPRHEDSFQLTVKPSDAAKESGKQHDVRVVWDTGQACYKASPAKLEIHQHDFVVWHCERSQGLPAYSVRGQGKAGSFSSSSFGPEAAFTHFFFAPGQYRYQVNGKGSYLIDVLDHRTIEEKAYSARVSNPPMVYVRQGRPTPDALEIVTGQTVIWVAEGESGVMIAVPLQPEAQIAPQTTQRVVPPRAT